MMTCAALCCSKRFRVVGDCQVASGPSGKSSIRAYVFRLFPNNGHRQDYFGLSVSLPRADLTASHIGFSSLHILNCNADA